MSPQATEGRLPGRRFPRVSGDEPFSRMEADQTSGFSPRERG